MHPKEYVEYIKRGEIPPNPPTKDTLLGGCIRDSCREIKGKINYRNYVSYRDVCTSYGLWIIIDKIWTHELSEWIANRLVLEIMAGGGWLTKALREYGVNIVATDNFSFGVHKHLPVTEVKRMEAIEAVNKINADILLISWPPYKDTTILKVCEIWGRRRPIIYIGEDGGCNAPEEFHDSFDLIPNHPKFSYYQWSGIHDQVMIGYWNPK